MPDHEAVMEAHLSLLQFARAAERIRAAAVAADALLGSLNAVTDLEPEVGPEIASVRQNINEAGEGLLRALTFLDARQEATMARLSKDAQ